MSPRPVGFIAFASAALAVGLRRERDCIPLARCNFGTGTPGRGLAAEPADE